MKYYLVLFALLFGCANPAVVIVEGKAGLPGADGANGIDGTNGVDGLNSLIAIAPAVACAWGGHTILAGLDSDRSGVLDPTEVTSSAEICNGADGADASVTAYTIVDVINPCGDAPSVYDEVLLKLANGSFLASFSDNASGSNTRFSIIPAGSYVTTDSTSCHFTIHADGIVTW